MNLRNMHSLDDLTKSVDVRDPINVYKTSKDLVAYAFPDVDFKELEFVFDEVNEMCQGNFNDFQKNNNPYHDQSHFLATYLASLRLLHGAHAEGYTIAPHVVVNTGTLALLHDIAMVPKKEDTGLGAEHTKGHEDASAAFINEYRKHRGFLEIPSDAYVQNVLDSTNLGIKPENITYVSDESKLVGHIVGTADLLAQMADKFYLEKLPGLYEEFKAAGLDEPYEDAHDLMKKTRGFYRFLIEPRLQALGDAQEFARAHFRDMHGIDRNLYKEAILQNLDYLDYVIEQDGFDTLLRRDYLHFD